MEGCSCKPRNTWGPQKPEEAGMRLPESLKQGDPADTNFWLASSMVESVLSQPVVLIGYSSPRTPIQISKIYKEYLKLIKKN